MKKFDSFLVGYYFKNENDHLKIVSLEGKVTYEKRCSEICNARK